MSEEQDRAAVESFRRELVHVTRLFGPNDGSVGEVRLTITLPLREWQGVERWLAEMKQKP